MWTLILVYIRSVSHMANARRVSFSFVLIQGLSGIVAMFGKALLAVVANWIVDDQIKSTIRYPNPRLAYTPPQRRQSLTCS